MTCTYSYLLLSVWSVLLFCCLASIHPMDVEDMIAERDRVLAEITHWLDSLPVEAPALTLTFGSPASPLRGESVTPNGLYAFRGGSKNDEVYIGVGWKGPLASSGGVTTLDALNSTLQHVAFDKIPVPLVSMRERFPHWNLRLVTRVSSFSDGVHITAFDPDTRAVTVHVDTEFFQVHGQRSDVLLPGCGPAPEGSYCSVRRNIRAAVTFTGSVPAPADAP
eukprot:TRINITY_DN5050_c0_g1_i1.p1 TRINITY_DN5050_c0_g1~~TRINITY_DN5050_c0_g1_i1.p1  ORF type:complete len:250 (+),score=14.04 TRINITY_DN5050_c0_g1_i1:90-752(+)